jgi:hypothetical protein
MVDSATPLTFPPAMSSTPRRTPAKAAEHGAREQRLAEALRENLRRRKEQARGKPAPAQSARKTGDEPPA